MRDIKSSLDLFKKGNARDTIKPTHVVPICSWSRKRENAKMNAVPMHISLNPEFAFP
jgi:hypothetical protein